MKKRKPKTKVFWAYVDHERGNGGWMLVGWLNKKAVNRCRNDAFTYDDSFEFPRSVGPLFQVEVPVEPMFKSTKRKEKV